jgi:quaternary ammonium compound-resistance protein SugE
MAWGVLILAGLFEIGFAIALKESQGFTKLWPTLAFLVFASISFLLLTRAIVHIPVGTAYAVWTGIGAAGAAVIGIFVYQEPAHFWRIFFILTLIASIAGLKLASE